MTKKWLLSNLLKSKLIEKNDRIVIGFSGGPDSVFLFNLLLEYKKIEPTFEMALAHVNHMLRGDDAMNDEAFSRDLAKENNIDFYSIRIDVNTLSKELKKSPEEVGREERYKFFNSILKKFHGNKVALAHNKDDQIETFLFRLMRGSSLEGLEGIKTKREIYIRPILNYSKESIINFLHDNAIDYAIDKTNFQSDYTRNSIRLELIPYMEKKYNPKVKDKIFQIIQEIKEINKYLERDNSRYIVENALNLEELIKEEEFIQKKIIVWYLNKNKLRVDRYKIDKISKLINEKKNWKISIENNFFMEKEYKLLKVKKEKNPIKGVKHLESYKNGINEIKIKLKEDIQINFGDYIIEIYIKNKDFLNKEEKNGKKSDIFFTNLKINDIITIRNRRGGDRFIPTGMKNHKKIKDFFIDEKIPKEERDKIPLVVFNDEIVWISGLRGSQLFNGDNNKYDRDIIIFKLRRM